MTHVISWQQIRAALPHIDAVAEMEQAFDSYSRGLAVVPPVGELLFDAPPGDAHIKYGYVQGDDVFVIKVATGFYHNPERDLPPTSGLILVFCKHTGQLKCVLLDEGHLTNVRTAAAGAVAAKVLAPPVVNTIGVIGTGQQARLQIEYLLPLFTSRQIYLWGRRREATESCANDLRAMGCQVEICATPGQASRAAQLVVTTTAAAEALLDLGDINPGTHITAMGSDTESKRELSTELVAAADLVVADSRCQCLQRGEIHHAVKAGSLDAGRIIELGDITGGRLPGRKSAQSITIADLTGVAVQDIAIAKAILNQIKT